MRVVIISREGEDYSRTVAEWVREFERRTGNELEVLSPDGREGTDFCRTYDVVEYPTILALNNDGSVLAEWRGQQLPLFDEVAYWL